MRHANGADHSTERVKRLFENIDDVVDLLFRDDEWRAKRGCWVTATVVPKNQPLEPATLGRRLGPDIPSCL
jgi:hypothetical protein